MMGQKSSQKLFSILTLVVGHFSAQQCKDTPSAPCHAKPVPSPDRAAIRIETCHVAPGP